MSNEQTNPPRPAFVLGDRVVYVGGQPQDEAPGTVIGVETIVQHKYIVEWDDNDPTDTYTVEQLSAEE